MRKFIYCVLSVVLCIAVVVGVLFVAESSASTPPNGTIIEDDSTGTGTTDDPGLGEDDGEKPSNGDNLNGGNETPDTEEIKPLKDPDNLSLLRINTMQTMSGASVYVGDDSSLDPAIRFTCLMENTLRAEIEADATKQAGILIAPLDYFEAVNPNAYTYMDWISEFDTAGKTSVLGLFDGYLKYDNDTSAVQFNLANVVYKNMNRQFVGIGVVITTKDGVSTYQYASFENGVDYRTNARSVAYVSSAALNAHVLGIESFDETRLAKLKSYVNMSVDSANGLLSPTHDDSTYDLKITTGQTASLTVGETYAIKTEITPNVAVPIWYRSTDTNVISVSSTGEVIAHKSGTATVRILLAGVEYGVEITVT